MSDPGCRLGHSDARSVPCWFLIGRSCIMTFVLKKMFTCPISEEAQSSFSCGRKQNHEWSGETPTKIRCQFPFSMLWVSFPFMTREQRVQKIIIVPRGLGSFFFFFFAKKQLRPEIVSMDSWKNGMRDVEKERWWDEESNFKGKKLRWIYSERKGDFSFFLSYAFQNCDIFSIFVFLEKV